MPDPLAIAALQARSVAARAPLARAAGAASVEAVVAGDATDPQAAGELARVLATRSPESTIVFAAVAGEEQGLYGSDHLAQKYREAGADIQGMFSNDNMLQPGHVGWRGDRPCRAASESGCLAR